MAMDKESSGLPEVDFRRPTTKVNLGIILAGAVFYVITFGAVIYYMRKSDAGDAPAPSAQSAPVTSGQK